MKKHMENNAIMAVFMIFILAAFILMMNASVHRSSLDAGQAEIICRITEVDDSDMIMSGVVMLGSQTLRGVVTGGPHDGETITLTNSLIGQYEFDQRYDVGDSVLAGVRIENDSITEAVPSTMCVITI